MKIAFFLKSLLVLLFLFGCENDTGSRKDTTTTQSQDINFTIEAVTNAELSTHITSSDINISGISGSVSVSLDTGTLIKNGTELSSNSTTIVQGDILAIKLLSSSSYSTKTSAYLTVAGAIRAFDVTTKAENLPDSFLFTAKTEASLGISYISNEVTIAGLEDNSTQTISIGSSGTIIHNGVILSTATATIRNGDTIAISLISSSSYSTVTTATVTIGSFSATYSITTVSQPTLLISPSSLSLSYGDTQTIEAEVTPSTLDYNLSWSSSDSSVVTVSSSGLLTAVGGGVATITAVATIGDLNITDSIEVGVNITATISIVEDSSGSLAHFETAENDSFVGVVLNRTDSKAFIATSLGVVIVDINSSSSTYMQEVVYIDINNTENIKLTYDDNRLFTASGYDGIVSLDVSTPSSASELARFDDDYNVSSKYAWSVALASNNVAYVAHCEGVDVFNIASSSSITRMDSLTIAGGSCDGIADKINKYDIVLSHDNSFAYLAYGSEGVHVIDRLNPYDIDINATYTDSECSDARSVDISIDGKTIFVACGSDGVDIVSVSDKSNIERIAKYPLIGTMVANDVKMSPDGSRLLITHGDGVDLVDITTPSSPTTIATFSSMGNAYASAFDSDGEYFYLSDDGNGLLKLKLVYE